MPPQDQTAQKETPSITSAESSTGPTPEQIEQTKKVMRDSLSARKPKGFLDSLKEWFR